MRTPRESAFLRKFFQGKSNFFLGRPRDIWDLKKGRYGDHVTFTAAVVDAESWGEYVTVAHLAA